MHRKVNGARYGYLFFLRAALAQLGDKVVEHGQVLIQCGRRNVDIEVSVEHHFVDRDIACNGAVLDNAFLSVRDNETDVTACNGFGIAVNHIVELVRNFRNVCSNHHFVFVVDHGTAHVFEYKVVRFSLNGIAVGMHGDRI